MKNLKTYQPKKREITRKWHSFDANGKILGRLSSEVATLLMGKHKPSYSSHMDSGDYVVITNVEKISVTGKKEKQKNYYRHSGYPGGFRQSSLKEVREKHPNRILEYAIYGMLPDNRLRAPRMRKDLNWW